MFIDEFRQQLKTSIELLGLKMGDMQSQECIEHSQTHPNCRGCEFETGCATYATVIYNILQRKKQGKNISEEDWDLEIQKQASLALAGIMPQKDDIELTEEEET